MSRKYFGKPAVFILLALLVFLCVIPAVSHAATNPGPMPEPTDSYETESGTTAERLCVLFRQDPSWTVVVRKADGSVRSSGFAETGDRVIITDSGGHLLDCIAVTVKGQPAPSSSQAASSAPVSSSNPAPVSSGTSSLQPEPSSVPMSSAVSSQQPAPSSSSVPSADPVFSESVPVETLAAVFGEKANCISVFMPGGAKRESGLVCTGDIIVLQDEHGNTIRTLTATVLGDLTRCGTVTETGRTLLYGYLTGQDSLSGDLLAAADMNRDGRVDTSDLLSMKIKLRGAALSDAASSGVK